MMRRFFLLGGFALWLCSCSNSGNSNGATDSGSNSTLSSDTNNASKNTGVDMSGGVNAGNFNKGDTTGIDLNLDSANRSDSGGAGLR